MNRQERRAAAKTGAALQTTLQQALQHFQTGQLAEAEPLLRRVLADEPQHPDALHLLGLVAYQRGDFPEAVRLIGLALKRMGTSAQCWNNLGNAQRALGQRASAAESYRRAIALAPDFPQAHNNLGIVLHDLGQIEAAEAAYRRAIALAAGYVQAHTNLGMLLGEIGRHAEAAESFRRTLALEPGSAETWFYLGAALKLDGRLDEAAKALRSVLERQPGNERALAMLLETEMYVCDWSRHGALSDLLRAQVGRPESVIVHDVFSVAAPGLNRADLLALARRQGARYVDRSQDRAAAAFPRTPKQRLRIGYLSADFREHPVSFLMAEVFERHDRARFDIHAYALGFDDASPMRQRVARAFTRFVPVGGLPVREVHRRIVADEVDILVDLMGYTRMAAPDLLALRSAPIQAGFLGYPGTMGPGLLDYLVADPVIVPPEHAPDYAEAIAYLDGCYQPNDRQREIAARIPSRAECGLPAEGFVFCAFHSPWKITPELFDIWAGLLRAVPGSVLWLRDFDPAATANLTRAAAERGIAGRLVFAPRAAYPEHLARHACADLFLDTVPYYNGHTTASDALWAGLPVVTCAGETFAGRVCGSLLRAANLPELATASLDDYRRVALELAQDPARLGELRGRLARDRLTCPLFDSELFTRNLESLYARMWDRYVAGQPPATIGLAAPA